MLLTSGAALVEVGAHGLLGIAGRLSRSDDLLADRFRPHVGSRFAVQHRSGPTDLTLTRVVTLPAPDVSGHAFSLIFSGPRSTALAQGTYSIQHDQLGVLHLFMTPVNLPRGGVQDFEIVVNRL